MLLLCDFSSPSRTCPACGYVGKGENHKRRCHPPGTVLGRQKPAQPQARPEGLAVGDLLAATLEAVGVTPERIARLTGRKACRCKQRQQALNEAGWAVQRAAKEFYLGK